MACVCSSAKHDSSRYSLVSGAILTMQLLMLLGCAQPAHLLEGFLASLANNHRKKLRWKAPLEVSISTPVEGKKIVSPIGMSLFSVWTNCLVFFKGNPAPSSLYHLCPHSMGTT